MSKIKGEAKPYPIGGLSVGAIDGAVMIMAKGNGYTQLNETEVVKLINLLSGFIGEEFNKKQVNRNE